MKSGRALAAPRSAAQCGVTQVRGAHALGTTVVVTGCRLAAQDASALLAHARPVRGDTLARRVGAVLPSPGRTQALRGCAAVQALWAVFVP